MEEAKERRDLRCEIAAGRSEGGGGWRFEGKPREGKWVGVGVGFMV